MNEQLTQGPRNQLGEHVYISIYSIKFLQFDSFGEGEGDSHKKSHNKHFPSTPVFPDQHGVSSKFREVTSVLIAALWLPALL